MPRGNGTGPFGMGSMTGRRAGYCAGFDMPGYANPSLGYGFGRTRGFQGGGRGWRHWFHATGLPGWMRLGAYGSQSFLRNSENERQALRSRADMLQAELESIRQRLDEIDDGSSDR